ncbi:LacI family DNA-binding transcriptional regulator [Mesobaculum littorinae]|uniref:LacI family DNA-binding transcriptional regulator n=1 Tax=Mesobaculum littorinae TaxID=2486419 RepID=A0A438AD36_9RHOB|nr:LacI family DNA-binding transcriptional regulator [Mesobaculum littorinae]RVV96594.1 LacI family DNA-binding transcriptional regulator [Mesobaculum littorinae]
MTGPGKDAGKRPTLRSVAERAGVSVATVSRALKDDPLIARETRARIARLVKEVGYTPDRAARGLRTGRSHVISVLISRHDEILGFGSSLISGMSRALRGTPYHVTVTPMFEDEEDLAPLRELLRGRAADGVVFTRTQPGDPRVRMLMKAGFPFVTHGRTDIAGHPWVDYDNAAFGRAAVAQLAAQGRRRVAMIVPPPRFTFHRFMTQGVAEAAQAAGMEIDWCDGIDLDTPAEALHAYVRDRLTGPGPAGCPRLDGLICSGEVSAIAASAAVTDAGLVPQRDVGLVAKQTTPLFGLMRPALPAIYEDIAGAGDVMAQLLMRAIDGAAPGGLHHLQTPDDCTDGPGGHGPVAAACEAGQIPKAK